MSGRSRRLLLFGGTTEGRLLAEYICDLDCYTLVCVATEYAKELLPSQMPVHIGPLDEAGIKKLILEEKPGLIIDATHPYAVEVTKNIRTAWKACGGIRLLRCLRESEENLRAGDKTNRLPEKGKTFREGDGGVSPDIVWVPNVEEAVRWLSKRKGRVLVTTGSKELSAYSRLEDFQNRLYVRILPTTAAMEACAKLGISEEHMIAAQGPFSQESNRDQLRKYNCSFLVTKDGGRAGGFQEKIQAARAEGAVALVIERPCKEEGISLEEIKRQVKEWSEQKEG